MVLSPPSFVSAGTWFKYRDTLLAQIPAEDEQRRQIYRLIDARNEELVASCNKTPPAARQILVRALDTTLQTPMSDDLPGICWDITKDKSNLVRTLLDWCTSLYRPGSVKVYVTCRILQAWSTRGVDITAAVLELADSDLIEQQADKPALYHLVGELARTGRFSIPRYFQWLMARGGVLAPTDVSPDGPCATRLLVELPTHSLSTSQRTMRGNMLRRAGYYVEDEAQDHEMAIRCLKHSLGLPMNVDGDETLPIRRLPISKLAKRVAKSSFTLKADVGSWLQSSLLTSFESTAKESSHPLEISSTTFNALRTICEAAEDFTMLAGILKSVSSVSSVEILASCADTVSRHVHAFAALDAAPSLFDALYARLRTTAEEQGIGARPLLASLSGLASRIPEKQSIAAQLKKDLAQTDRNNPVDACSPVSDIMGIQDEDADLQEEIEKSLTSGTSLDRSTMNRLFEAVVTRLNAWWGQHAEKQRRYGILLARLRGFDHQHFDSLIAKWIHHLRSITNRPSILRMFPLLMGVGCLHFPLLLASTSPEQSIPATGASRTAVPGTSSSSAQLIQVTYRTRYCQDVLGMVTKPLYPDDLVTQEECYRIAIMQDQALKDHSSEILALVRQALAEYALCRDKGDTEALPLDNTAEREHLIRMLRSLVLRDSPAVIKAMSLKSPDPHVGGWIDCIATRLLIPTAVEGTQVTFDQILELTDEFTLPFCQLKISLSLSLADQSNPDAADPVQAHLDLFTKAMDNAIDAKNTSWTGMLSSLSPEITHHLKSRAQARLLDLLPSLRTPPPAAAGDKTLQTAQNLLSVVDAIIRGGSMGRPPQLVPAMVDKLVDLWEVLASPSTDPSGKGVVLNHWLPALLALLTLHTSTFDSSKAGFEVRARAVIVLSGLLQELGTMPPSMVLGAASTVSPTTTTTTNSTPPITLANRIFDLACLLVDSLNDEVRAQCQRVVNASADARLRYIFSIPRNPSEHLMLSHKDKPSAPGLVAATATGPPGAGATGAARPPLGPGHLLGTPASLWAQTVQGPERLTAFQFRRWEMLNEPTPNVGENDTALSLGLFEARKVL
jgi:mediator of RNA polymerase II transcription subunit 12